MTDAIVTDKKARYQRVAYYPGCALEGTGHAYNTSTRQVGKALGLELDEVPNWNCCGAMEVKNIDPKVQTYLSSRVMAIAAHEMKADVVMAPCNGCYHNLKKAEYDLANDAASREVVCTISQKAGHETYKAGEVETIHVLDWLKQGIGEAGLRARVKQSLKGLKIANYYGCMLILPPGKRKRAALLIYLRQVIVQRCRAQATHRPDTPWRMLRRNRAVAARLRPRAAVPVVRRDLRGPAIGERPHGADGAGIRRANTSLRW